MLVGRRAPRNVLVSCDERSRSPLLALTAGRVVREKTYWSPGDGRRKSRSHKPRGATCEGAQPVGAEMCARFRQVQGTTTRPLFARSWFLRFAPNSRTVHERTLALVLWGKGRVGHAAGMASPPAIVRDKCRCRCQGVPACYDD